MCNNKSISPEIFEKDRPILGYLIDVVLEQHSEDYGFDLTFKFEKNAYFKQTELKKSFMMKQQNTCEKAIGTEIQWTDASCDVTKTKKKKGKGKKKVNVVVKCDSFFNFFGTCEEQTEVEQDDDEEEPEDPNDQLHKDMELGTTIRDDLVSLALEFYLGVIEQESDDDDEFHDNSDDDDDAEEIPKKAKKGKKDDDTPSDAKAKEECKQQ